LSYLPSPPLALDACLPVGRGEGRGEGEQISVGFTHVSTQSIGKIKSPLDSLNLKKGDDK